jgi:hypothetical protein
MSAMAGAAGYLVCVLPESPVRLVSVSVTTAPLGVVFLHGGVAVKLLGISPSLGVFSPGENHDSACLNGDGGVSNVASLLKASPWRQYMVHMPSVLSWCLAWLKA